ncbi:unnamed protein product [Urochloa decumbens]|uniref:Uncharacterized protein n=1 Tax=Urochloa decumbens TaxID=240449 RepID=A0ABC9E823_9POAL
MSALLVRMRRVFGDETANATLARSILAAVANKLPSSSSSSGGGADGENAPDLHRRCVLFDCAPSRVRVDAVCAALAPPPPGPGSGAGDIIEAVALCGYYVVAVVVFRTAAGAEAALRGSARRSCHAVPPLHLGVEIPFIGPTDVKIMPDLLIPEPSTPPPPEPEPVPWIEFREPSVEAYRASGSGRLPPGTRRFHPSCESLVHGPTRGADGSLWMYGDFTVVDKHGMEIGHEKGTSVRVRRTDPPPPEDKRPNIPDTAIWFEPYETKF